jgi:hypothetical protein
LNVKVLVSRDDEKKIFEERRVENVRKFISLHSVALH